MAKRVERKEQPWRMIWRQAEAVPDLWCVSYARPPKPRLHELVITPRPGVDLIEAWAQLKARAP